MTPKQKAVRWMLARVAGITLSVTVLFLGGYLGSNGHEISGLFVLASPFIAFLIAMVVVIYQDKVREFENNETGR